MRRDFQFFAPIRMYKSDSAAPGQQRRIAGVISTEDRDQQGEILLQQGLDFNRFLRAGYYNDNHKQGAGDILGYPTEVKRFRKGEQLPDGTSATSNCTWAEGYLFDGYPKADEIWNLGMAMSKSGGARSLGFSVEGTVKKRAGSDRKIIAAAEIANVAITHCPVNASTKLHTLIKSLQDAEAEFCAEELASVTSVQKSAGPTLLTPGAALDMVLARFPGISLQTAGRVVELATNMQSRGLL